MELLKSDNLNITPKSKTISTTAKVLISITGGLGIGLSIVCASFVAPAFRKICLPYVPATTQQVKNVLFLVESSRNHQAIKLLDIGSGDGRIVIAAAKKGINADGVELNSWLVFYSRLAALRHGVGKYTHFFRKDLWKFNIMPYNYVVIFGVEQMMRDLENKLIAESLNDTKVIACRFPLPTLEPQRIIGEGVDTVWLYELSKNTK